jgi:hypothetical protein
MDCTDDEVGLKTKRIRLEHNDMDKCSYKWFLQKHREAVPTFGTFF